MEGRLGKCSIHWLANLLNRILINGRKCEKDCVCMKIKVRRKKCSYPISVDFTISRWPLFKKNSKMSTVFSKVISHKYLYLVINYSLCSSNCQGIDRCQIRKRKFCLFFLSPVSLFQIPSFRLHSNYETTILSKRFPFSTLFLKKTIFYKITLRSLLNEQSTLSKQGVIFSKLRE